MAVWNVGSEKVSPLPQAPNVLEVLTQSVCPLQVDEHLRIPAKRRGVCARHGRACDALKIAGPGIDQPRPGVPGGTHAHDNPLSLPVNEAQLVTSSENRPRWA